MRSRLRRVGRCAALTSLDLQRCEPHRPPASLGGAASSRCSISAAACAQGAAPRRYPCTHLEGSTSTSACGAAGPLGSQGAVRREPAKEAQEVATQGLHGAGDPLKEGQGEAEQQPDQRGEGGGRGERRRQLLLCISHLRQIIANRRPSTCSGFTPSPCFWWCSSCFCCSCAGLPRLQCRRCVHRSSWVEDDHTRVREDEEGEERREGRAGRAVSSYRFIAQPFRASEG